MKPNSALLVLGDTTERVQEQLMGSFRLVYPESASAPGMDKPKALWQSVKSLAHCQGVALADGWRTNPLARQLRDIAYEMEIPIKTVDGWIFTNARSKRRTAYATESKKRTLEKMNKDEKHQLHGTNKGYGMGCRCESCRAARSEYIRARKKARKK